MSQSPLYSALITWNRKVVAHNNEYLDLESPDLEGESLFQETETEVIEVFAPGARGTLKIEEEQGPRKILKPSYNISPDHRQIYPLNEVNLEDDSLLNIIDPDVIEREDVQVGCPPRKKFKLLLQEVKFPSKWLLSRFKTFYQGQGVPNQSQIQVQTDPTNQRDVQVQVNDSEWSEDENSSDYLTLSDSEELEEVESEEKEFGVRRGPLQIDLEAIQSDLLPSQAQLQLLELPFYNYFRVPESPVEVNRRSRPSQGSDVASLEKRIATAVTTLSSRGRKLETISIDENANLEPKEFPENQESLPETLENPTRTLNPDASPTATPLQRPSSPNINHKPSNPTPRASSKSLPLHLSEDVTSDTSSGSVSSTSGDSYSNSDYSEASDIIEDNQFLFIPSQGVKRSNQSLLQRIRSFFTRTFSPKSSKVQCQSRAYLSGPSSSGGLLTKLRRWWSGTSQAGVNQRPIKSHRDSVKLLRDKRRKFLEELSQFHEDTKACKDPLNLKNYSRRKIPDKTAASRRFPSRRPPDE